MSSAAGRLTSAILVLALVLAGATGPAAGQSTAESTIIQIDLQENGDARWTVILRFALDDANETAAFERLTEEYLDGETDVLAPDPYRTAAALAGEETGRTMAVTAIDRTASQANETGELRLSFTWTNFTRVADGGDRLVLGDVFRTPSGTWLPRLGSNQVLVIEFPDGFSVESVSRGLENRSIRVTGPATFEPGKPSATLERSREVVTTPTSPGSGIGAPSALTGGVALAVLLLVAFLLYRRRTDEETAAPGGDASGPAAAAPPDEAVDEELLSDEERVLRLLRAEGGRMKQVDIVEETDWSNAKVSQLLSSMAEDGRVEKLRIGRENLISLPDEKDE
jgi:hypothetical protein